MVLVAAATWWFFHENPEAEVRNAHQELSRLLSKTEGESAGAILLDAHILKGLFAEACEVTGDDTALVRSYTPDEMVSMILQVQGVFLHADLVFHELIIDFPTENNALVNFTAVLIGRSKIEGEEAVAETREVVSRLQKIDGKWLFSNFKLIKLSPTDEIAR